MKLLAFSVSLRKGSFNRKLIKLAVNAAQKKGVEIELLDLLDYEMPAYNGDIETNVGLPEAAARLKQKLESAQGLIISTPEYNFSYPGHFKNTFDWVTRFQPMPWTNKAVLLLSASMSLVGGNRGLWHLRVPFEYAGGFVFPLMFSLASAHQAFNEKDELSNPDLAQRLEEMVGSFIRFAEHLKY